MEWGCTAAARHGQPRATDTRSARPAGARLLLGRCRLQLHAWLERVERMLFLSHAAVADRESVLRRQSRQDPPRPRARSEERSVGKRGVMTLSARWGPYN